MNKVIPITQWLDNTRPDNTLIAWHKEHQWTLGQLRNDVACLIEQLTQQPGSRWALCFEDSYPFIVALLAALSLGKTPVIPGHSRLSLLHEQNELFDGILSDKMLDWDGEFIHVDMFNQAKATLNTMPTISSDSVVELFTSGSTGKPKQIIKPVRCLDTEANILSEIFGQELIGKRVVASIVPQHMYGLTFRIFLPMALGLPLHNDMLLYAEKLSALEPNHSYIFISSPAFLKRLDTQLPPPKVEFIFSAGGELPWPVVENSTRWFKTSPTEIYGSTETGVLAWRRRTDEQTSWQCFPGIQIIEKQKCFWAQSPLIADPQGLPLDDQLHFASDGSFVLQGRKDRAVKIEEKRISLTDVERRLQSINGIKEAAALPVMRGNRQGIGAVLVLDKNALNLWESNKKATEFEWRCQLLAWLEPVAIPRFWRVVEDIPTNSMGKRVQSQLTELFNEA